MTANINPETGVRYGTIYLNNLASDLASDLFYNGTNVSEDEAIEELRREINAEIENDVENGDVNVDEIEWEFERRFDRAAEHLQIDEPTIMGTYEGVEYMISWLGGAPLLWVLKSPIITTAALCSPCVPNAGDLDSPGDYECYGIPDDWRAK